MIGCPKKPQKWITIVASAYCSPGGPAGISYSSDLREFETRKQAVAYGFNTLNRSDDFNIGEIRDGRLVALWWMDRPLDKGVDGLETIASEIGL